MRRDLLLYFMGILLMITSGCNLVEKNEVDYNSNRNTAIDQVLAENLYKDIFNMVFTAFTDSALFHQGLSEIYGGTALYDPAQNQISISFGSYFQLCPDQRYRRGTISARFDRLPLEDQSQTVIQLDALYAQSEIVEPLKASMLYQVISGNETIQNLGRSNDGHMIFQHTVTDGMVIDSNQVMMTWNGDEIYEWTAGEPTLYFPDDDYFLIESTTSGTSFNGIEFITSTSGLLADDFGCKWIRHGIINILTPSLEIKSGMVDYIQSDGCNNIVHFIYGDIVLYDKLR